MQRPGPRYKEALAAAEQASEDSPAVHFTGWALVELVEAAVRSGVPRRAAGALQRLSGTARFCGTDWALGAEAGSRALVGNGAAAESLYREAIDRFWPYPPAGGPGPRPSGLRGVETPPAAAERDARDQLGRAYEIFDSIGAAGFAERARIELRASRARPANAPSRRPIP